MFARRYFTYLADSRAAVDVSIGDARLSIERELRDGTGAHAYDVLAIDAFSGDAIPVHLLTREAFARYADGAARRRASSPSTSATSISTCGPSCAGWGPSRGKRCWR